MGDPGLDRLHEWQAEAAVILGSGLNSVAGDTDSDRIIAYSEFKEIPPPSVVGHSGQFVLGEIGKTRVIYAQGRVHLYEGFSARDVMACVRLLAQAGVNKLILTNAAGSLNPKFSLGEWMMISDQINLTGTSPLVGGNLSATRIPGGRRAVGAQKSQTPRSVSLQKRSSRPFPNQFLDLAEVYSPRLRKQFAQAARKISITLHEGIYASVLGPQYETPAEVRMLRSLGADAVGMSTVLEAIQARALGLEVAAFSCLTNFASGISRTKLSHGEVVAIANSTATDFAKLLKTVFAIAAGEE